MVLGSSPVAVTTHFHFAIFFDSNQLISDLKEGPKGFYLQLSIAMNKICITFYHAWYHIFSHLFTPCHTLSPRLETKPFSFGNFKTSSQAPNFLSHLINALSLLITPYHTLSPKSEATPILFGNFQNSSQIANFLSHLITPSHFLSHPITPYPLGWKKTIFNWQL